MTSQWNPVWDPNKARKPRLDLSLESRVESAELAESLVVEFSIRAGYDERELEEIGLAVRESVANAVLHGNRCDPAKKVTLRAELRGPGLVISVRDEGEGFDPQALADPLVPDNLFQESGRGFFLVKTCMDEVSVSRHAGMQGMELQMVKYRSKTSRRRMPR